MHSFIKRLLREGIHNTNKFYHGSRSMFPFQRFEKRMDGSGIVNSGGKRFGGMFFTSDIENAEYYTEWFVCEVIINNYKTGPQGSHPPSVMKLAIQNNQTYIIHDILDGAKHSDIVVVPFSCINDIKIVNWIFVGDEDSYFKYMDEQFIHDPEDTHISKGLIDSIINMTGGELDYLLNIPIFRKYYESKEED